MALYECNNNRKSIKCQPVIMVANNYNDKQLYWIQSVLNKKLFSCSISFECVLFNGNVWEKEKERESERERERERVI